MSDTENLLRKSERKDPYHLKCRLDRNNECTIPSFFLFGKESAPDTYLEKGRCNVKIEDRLCCKLSPVSTI